MCKEEEKYGDQQQHAPSVDVIRTRQNSPDHMHRGLTTQCVRAHTRTHTHAHTYTHTAKLACSSLTSKKPQNGSISHDCVS